MRRDALEALLGEVLGRTLEEAAFVFAEPADDRPPLGPAVLEARLAYAGPGPDEGELVLATSPELAARLAANLLGEDEGGAVATGDDQDAVGELLNMMAGVFVAERFGADEKIRIGLPSVRRIAADAYAAELERAAGAAVLVEEEEGRRIDLSARARSAR